MKTTVMTIGEMDFVDMFHGSNPHYPAITYVVFVAFMAVMTIIIMNLLVRCRTVVVRCGRVDQVDRMRRRKGMRSGLLEAEIFVGQPPDYSEMTLFCVSSSWYCELGS